MTVKSITLNHQFNINAAQRCVHTTEQQQHEPTTHNIDLSINGIITSLCAFRRYIFNIWNAARNYPERERNEGKK